jgi:hypothetical protein
MPVLKCYVSREEEKIIRAYASEDSRPVSELLFHGVRGLINRSKKKGPDNELLEMPPRMR